MPQAIFWPRTIIDRFRECLKFPPKIPDYFPLPARWPIRYQPLDQIRLQWDNPPLSPFCLFGRQIDVFDRLALALDQPPDCDVIGARKPRAASNSSTPRTKGKTQLPPDRQQNDLRLKLTPLE
jgi:hypothetical protein